jgi:hypothetical protein
VLLRQINVALQAINGAEGRLRLNQRDNLRTSVEMLFSQLPSSES